MAKRQSEPFQIIVQTIPHSEQRYDTLGDWFYVWDTEMNKTLHVKVSNTGDWRSNVLIAMHEIAEAVLCDEMGITQAQVDEFDMAHPELDEPGDDPHAPYGTQHCFAMAIERMMAAAMTYPWADHEKLCEETANEHHPSRQHGSTVPG